MKHPHSIKHMCNDVHCDDVLYDDVPYDDVHCDDSGPNSAKTDFRGPKMPHNIGVSSTEKV